MDGMDGDLARMKGMGSAFGGFLDSVLDRYADSLIILGLTIWAASDDAPTYVWLVGFWALAGTFVVTYTRSKIASAEQTMFDRGIHIGGIQGRPPADRHGGGPRRPGTGDSGCPSLRDEHSRGIAAVQRQARSQRPIARRAHRETSALFRRVRPRPDQGWVHVVDILQSTGGFPAESKPPDHGTGVV